MKRPIRASLFRAAFAFLAVAALSLASCASLQPAPSEKAARNLLSLIDSGKMAARTDLWAIPFSLDGERLYLERDIARLWERLRDTGSFRDARVAEIRDEGDGRYSIVAESAIGRWTLSVEEKSARGLTIQGLSGPEPGIKE